MYGLGAVAYFHMIKSVLKIMAAMALLVLPIIVMYNSEKGLSTVTDHKPSWFVRYSFGNIGFSGPDCSRSPV